MQLQYIGETPAEGNHAGNKARRDVDAIFARRGYTLLENVVETRFDSTLEKVGYVLRASTWKKVIGLRRVIDRIVLAQFPIYGNKLMRQTLNEFFERNRMIFVIHDLDALRNFAKASASDEIARLNRAEILIVHNRKMLERLRELGVTTTMIDLELFDYLLDDELPRRSSGERNSIVFAGNLSKSEFLKSLGALEINFNLYGPGGETLSTLGNAEYRGSFSPDEVPYKLVGGFGLIWDGDSIDTCSGAYGEYLRLNNPHKLSLYIAAGLPVVTWKHAAIADFVLDNRLGFVVESLSELQSRIASIGEDEYRTFLDNSARIQKQLAVGYYTNRALDRVEQLLGGST